MEIVLLRHGKPSYTFKGKARASDISREIELYDKANLADHPTPEALDIALRCDSVVCSALSRSLETANALGFEKINSTNAHFNEAALPHFKRGDIVMPIVAWVAVLRIFSLSGFSRHGESYLQCKQRATQATKDLITTAQNHQRTLLVGHGIFNHFIAKELRKQNWLGPKSPGKSHWSFAVYTKIDV